MTKRLPSERKNISKPGDKTVPQSARYDFKMSHGKKITIMSRTAATPVPAQEAEVSDTGRRTGPVKVEDGRQAKMDRARKDQIIEERARKLGTIAALREKHKALQVTTDDVLRYREAERAIEDRLR